MTSSAKEAEADVDVDDIVVDSNDDRATATSNTHRNYAKLLTCSSWDTRASTQTYWQANRNLAATGGGDNRLRFVLTIFGAIYIWMYVCIRTNVNNSEIRKRRAYSTRNQKQRRVFAKPAASCRNFASTWNSYAESNTAAFCAYTWESLTPSRDSQTLFSVWTASRGSFTHTHARRALLCCAER